jgi:nitrate/nitrite transporter NarK
MQDKYTPRIVAMIGGVLTGAGLICASLSTGYGVWVLGFGVLLGAGMGFGYASATPPAIKWFPPSRTGQIAGLVVAGFGLASVYIAPLSQYLIGAYGLTMAMRIFGVAFIIVVGVLAQFLIAPPAGYKPPETAAQAAAAPLACEELGPIAMMKTNQFWKLWFMFFVGSGAGLIVIGNAAGMAAKSLGVYAWAAPALLAIGNASGRIVAGILSDKIGRAKTLVIMLTCQAAIIFALLLAKPGSDLASNVLFMVFAATYIGFNYGSNLSLFPTSTKVYFGGKNFGANYGMVFTAWGIGGFILPRVAQMIFKATGSYDNAYILAGCLLLASAAVALITKSPARTAALAAACDPKAV